MANEVKVDFAAKLAAIKKEHGMSVGKGPDGSSTFSLIKEIMQQNNKTKAEVLVKTIDALEAKNVVVTKEIIVKVQKLLGNMLTYTRHPETYTHMKGFRLIESDTEFRIVKTN